MEAIANRKVKIDDLSKDFLEKLTFTILPDQRTVLHFLSSNFLEL